MVKGNTIIIPVAGITRVVMNTISYAKTLSDNVVAVYVGVDDEAIQKMEQKWEEWDVGIRLVVLRSRYRSIINPLRKFIDTVEWKKQTRTISLFSFHNSSPSTGGKIFYTIRPAY